MDSSETTSLPANAYKPLAPGEAYLSPKILKAYQDVSQ